MARKAADAEARDTVGDGSAADGPLVRGLGSVAVPAPAAGGGRRPRAADEVWFAVLGALPGSRRLWVLGLMGPLRVRAAIAQVDRLARRRVLRRTPAFRALPAADRATVAAVRGLAVRCVVELHPHAAVWFAMVRLTATLLGSTPAEVFLLMGPVMCENKRSRDAMPRRPTITANHLYHHPRAAIVRAVDALRRALRCQRRRPAFRALPAAERNAAEELTVRGMALVRWRLRVSARWLRLHPPPWAVVRRHPRPRAAANDIWFQLLGVPGPRSRLMAPLRARRRVSARWLQLHPPPGAVAHPRPRAAAEVWFAEVDAVPGLTRPLWVLALMGPLRVGAMGAGFHDEEVAAAQRATAEAVRGLAVAVGR
ncbi:MAG: hypothetical protein M1826_005622 [Phylliscum demangeonii]|nr:MAG: hypothetical protein M1826_005622 [Phylliscum demangeonii]